jgi:hypothetical protein
MWQILGYVVTYRSCQIKQHESEAQSAFPHAESCERFGTPENPWSELADIASASP